MQIARLEVEEGFLDGLDLEFSAGLNVVIGSRGTGKTSIIELIRWALGVTPQTAQFATRSRNHVSQVLGSGQVTVTADIEGSQVRFSRTASEDVPRVSSPVRYTEPLILSQNEIELLGLQAEGRLRLVDEFRKDSIETSEVSLLAAIGSATAEVGSLLTRLADLDNNEARIDEIGKELDEARSAQEAFGVSLAGLDAERARLDELSSLLAGRSGEATALEQLRRQVDQALERVRSVGLGGIRIPTLSDERNGLSGELKEAIDKADDHLRSALVLLEGALERVDSTVVEFGAVDSAEGDEARDLRRRLNEVSEGSGAAARLVADLEGARERATRHLEQANEVRASIAEVKARRAELLSRLDRVRAERVDARSAVISDLNGQFGPAIRFGLDALGDYEDYSRALMETLRGSGVHYNSVAPEIAASLSPAELIGIVESFDVAALADASGITSDRAVRLVAALAEGGLDRVATSRVGDRVEISILDRGKYKRSTEMSTGQRCSAVLPVLLRHDDRVVIIDQPEDNLDTFYIVDTVVKAMASRRPNSQLICATHNANIPVLAEATKVIQLGSDGQRGYVEREGRLADESITKAILSIMEGGRDAFERRSMFYGPSDE